MFPGHDATPLRREFKKLVMRGFPAFMQGFLNTNTQAAARSTLGLVIGTDVAPVNSPAFTGIPAAPTAASTVNTTQVATMAALQTGIALRSYIAGLTLSTAGSSTTMSIAAGQAADSSNAFLMTVAATSKTTSAWAVGSAFGGLDTGTIANSTWYYFYAIRRPDTGVVDVVFSLSATSPTLPTNYTQYRYIGGGKTNGSAQWTKFIQTGDDFYWDTPVVDYTGVGSTTATTQTLTVPRKRVKAHLNIQLQNGASYVSDLSLADLAPTVDAATNPLGMAGAAGGNIFVTGQAFVWTNTSAQIRRRENSANTSGYVTLGWMDLRGKDA